MSAQTSWASEALTVTDTAPFEIAEAASAQAAFARNKYSDSGLPRITSDSFGRVIGKSPALQAVLEQVKRVASTDSTVLIRGETGTGKELIAHAIHNLSSRSGRAFVRVNCAAIPLDLLESELFGHERGAFTGAIAQRVGRFELADKGTLFLDEVGEHPGRIATQTTTRIAGARV
jgi:transcriptional regulator with GAF, ATPase, and Fis domain